MAEPAEPDEFDDFEEDEADLDDLELQLTTDDLITKFVDDKEEYERISIQKNHTRPVLTKYEKARVLGVRAQQIESGSNPLVEIGREIDPIKMAQKEMQEKLCPCQVKRPIPGRDPYSPQYEIYSVNALK